MLTTYHSPQGRASAKLSTTFVTYAGANLRMNRNMCCLNSQLMNGISNTWRRMTWLWPSTTWLLSERRWWMPIVMVQRLVFTQTQHKSWQGETSSIHLPEDPSLCERGVWRDCSLRTKFTAAKICLCHEKISVTWVWMYHNLEWRPTYIIITLVTSAGEGGGVIAAHPAWNACDKITPCHDKMNANISTRCVSSAVNGMKSIC